MKPKSTNPLTRFMLLAAAAAASPPLVAAKINAPAAQQHSYNSDGDEYSSHRMLPNSPQNSCGSDWNDAIQCGVRCPGVSQYIYSLDSRPWIYNTYNTTDFTNGILLLFVFNPFCHIIIQLYITFTLTWTGNKRGMSRGETMLCRCRLSTTPHDFTQTYTTAGTVV